MFEEHYIRWWCLELLKKSKEGLESTHFPPSWQEWLSDIQKKFSFFFEWKSISDISEAAARGLLWKKVFSEISQNSQENTCARDSFLIKLHARPATLLKKRLWHRRFPVNFAKILRTPFSQNNSGRLFLLRLTFLLPPLEKNGYLKKWKSFVFDGCLFEK